MKIATNTTVPNPCLRLRSLAVCVYLAAAVISEGKVPLSSLPKVTKIWVGTEKAFVTSAQYQEIFSVNKGEIQILAKDGQWLKKGQHWATTSPESVTLEKESFDLDKKKNDIVLEEFTDKEELAIAALNKSLQDLADKENELAVLSRQDHLQAEVRRKIVEARAEIKKRVLRINDKLSPERRSVKLELKKEELNLAIRKKERFLKTLIENSELKAPFAGRLSLHLENVSDEGEDAILIDLNIHFATITDDRQYSIEVKPSPLSQYNASLKQMEVMMSPDSEGVSIKGSFERAEKIQSSSQGLKKWIFAVNKNQMKNAEKSMGDIRIGHLFKKLDKPAHLVMKRDLFDENPEILKNRGWAGLIAFLWPDARIVFIGPQSIALLPKDPPDGNKN